MTISKLKVLINGLINMINNGAQEDEELDEHQKGYNEGYREALEGIKLNLSTDDEEDTAGRLMLEDWLKENGFSFFENDDADEVWMSDRACDSSYVRLRKNDAGIVSCGGVAVFCRYDDMWCSKKGSLMLGDFACVYPPEEKD